MFHSLDRPAFFKDACILGTDLNIRTPAWGLPPAARRPALTNPAQGMPSRTSRDIPHLTIPGQCCNNRDRSRCALPRPVWLQAAADSQWPARRPAGLQSRQLTVRARYQERGQQAESSAPGAASLLKCDLVRCECHVGCPCTCCWRNGCCQQHKCSGLRQECFQLSR